MSDLSRRNFLAMCGFAAAAPLCLGGCAAAVAAAEEPLVAGMVTLFATGLLEGFGQQLAEAIVDNAPVWAKETKRALMALFGSPDVPAHTRYNNGPAPARTLQSIAAAAPIDTSGTSSGAFVVHQVAEGPTHTLPLPLAVGLNYMMRIEAGDRTDLRQPSTLEIRRAMEPLRPRYAIADYRLVEGVDNRLDGHGRFEAINFDGQTMSVDWWPSPTRLCRLGIMKGVLVEGPQPSWKDVTVSKQAILLRPTDVFAPVSVPA